MHRLPIVALAAAACLSLAGPAAAATLFSDNFNGETLATNGSLSQWTISNGTIDVIGNPAFFDFYLGNGRYVDLDGSTQNAGRIETGPLALNIGQTYTLSFNYGRNGTAAESMTFGVTDNLSQLFSLPAGGAVPFSFFSVNFVAAAATGRIFFDHAGGDNQGIVLDNVLLQSVDTAVVPVPAALPLLITGLLGLGFAARRRS